MTESENINIDASEPVDIDDEGIKDYGKGQHPWRRFFARFLDTMVIEATVILIAAGIFSVKLATNDTTYIFIASAFLLAIYDGFFLSRFGTTPFKWALGIKVESDGPKKTGEKLSFATAAKRTLWLNLYALYFVPLINLFAAMVCYQVLMIRHTTKWDEKMHSKVTYGKITMLKILSIIAFLVLYSLVTKNFLQLV